MIRLWDEVDWTKFCNKMKIRTYFLPKIMNEKKLDKMVESLYKNINDALDYAAPLVKAKNKGRNFHWYTNEHAEISKAVNKLYIKAMKSGKEDDYKEYKQEQKYY